MFFRTFMLAFASKASALGPFMGRM